MIVCIYIYCKLMSSKTITNMYVIFKKNAVGWWAVRARGAQAGPGRRTGPAGAVCQPSVNSPKLAPPPEVGRPA